MQVPPSALPNRPRDVFTHELNAICGSFTVDHDQAVLPGYARCESRSGLDLAFVGQACRSIRRTAQNIRSDPGNHFFLVLQAQGAAQMQQADSDVLLQAGDMFLVDSTRPSTFFYDQNVSHQISVHLPRDETVHRFGRHVYGGMKIGRGDPLSQAMRAILQALQDAQSAPTTHVSEAFYSVLGAYLFSRNAGHKEVECPNRQLALRALNTMSQHYANPDLSPALVAREMGVSLRKLQRAFEVIQSSPHKRLQHMRLDAAREALEQRNATQPCSITAVAFECGFRDLSTFYRLFKKRYGCSPKAWRAVP